MINLICPFMILCKCKVHIPVHLPTSSFILIIFFFYLSSIAFIFWNKMMTISNFQIEIIFVFMNQFDWMVLIKRIYIKQKQWKKLCRKLYLKFKNSFLSTMTRGYINFFWNTISWNQQRISTSLISQNLQYNVVVIFKYFFC